MPEWELDSLRDFVEVMLSDYPTPDETITYTQDWEDSDDRENVRVGHDEISAYRELVYKDGVRVVEELVDGSYSIAAPRNANLAHIPYVAVLADYETKSTKYGRYPVYLFDPINDKAYLTLNIGAGSMAEDFAKRVSNSGVGQEKRDQSDILNWLANWYRGMCQTPDEFSPGPIDFPSRLKRAKPYGNGTIFYREYTTEDLPSQEELVSDLETVVEIYSDLLNRRATNINLDLDGKQVWQVSPGSNEDRWPAWEEDEVASIGWNLHPEEFDRDISEIDSLDETSIRVDEGQGFAYRFSQEIAVGDVIVAAIRGKSNPDKVYGVGRVTDTDPDVESRELHENIQDDNHFVSVDWAEFGTYVPITLGANDPLTTKTLTDIDEDDARHLFGTTLAHATAGGLYTDVAEAASALDQATELDVEVVESSEQPDSTSDEDPDDSDDTDSGDAETEGGPWTLSEIDRMEPDFGKGPDDIDLNELYFEDEGELLSEILDALRREKHLLFVGPPGTGKSKLASRVANELVGHEYEMTTATADWSTFDTIGGYRQQTDGELVFKPGLFLSRFQDGDGRPDHEWLIVDEFNRANIDKAFGSLFSVLAGDDVVLPFVDERDRDITVLGSEVKPARSIGSHEFVVPDTWRLLATMNTFDKSSLYDLSYALSRRFAYIHVPAPDYDDIDVSLVNSYVGCWKGINPSDDEIESTTELWKAVQQERPLGPAIIRDILSAADGDITAGVTQHVLPQFEGLMKRRQEDLLSRIADVDAVQSDRIGSFGRQYFELHDLALTDEAE